MGAELPLRSLPGIREFSEALDECAERITQIREQVERVNLEQFNLLYWTGEDSAALADRIIRGTVVHGFENDADIARVMSGLRPTIISTIEHAVCRNESRKTNPSKEFAETQSGESQAIDRGELVNTLLPYLEHRQSWKPHELADVLADAVIRTLRGTAS